MFENIMSFFKNIGKKEEKKELQENSKNAAKERLHLVLMQDRANVSADFLELMKQEIIDVIKKYIEVDEKEIDVRLTNKENEDGTNGAPSLYANIPILNIKNEVRKINKNDEEEQKGNGQSDQNESKNQKDNEEKKSDGIEEEQKCSEQQDNEKKDKDKKEKRDGQEDKEKKSEKGKKAKEQNDNEQKEDKVIDDEDDKKVKAKNKKAKEMVK